MSTQAQVKQLAHDVAKLYAVGHSTLAISNYLNISYSKVLTSRKHIAEDLSKEAGTLWVTFLLQYQKQSQELQLMLQTAKDKNNLNAQIGVIRSLTDLTEKMASYAQSIGLIKEKPVELIISLEQQAANLEKLFNFNGIEQKHLVNSN